MGANLEFPTFSPAKALMDTGGSSLAQAALVDFIHEGHFERHLHRMRTRNASRRAAMLEAIERNLGDRVQVSGVNAGLHLMLWLREMPASKTRSPFLGRCSLPPGH